MRSFILLALGLAISATPLMAAPTPSEERSQPQVREVADIFARYPTPELHELIARYMTDRIYEARGLAGRDTPPTVPPVVPLAAPGVGPSNSALTSPSPPPAPQDTSKKSGESGALHLGKVGHFLWDAAKVGASLLLRREDR